MTERVVCSVRRFNIAYRVMLEIVFLNYNREHYTALYSRSSQEKTSRHIQNLVNAIPVRISQFNLLWNQLHSL